MSPTAPVAFLLLGLVTASALGQQTTPATEDLHSSDPNTVRAVLAALRQAGPAAGPCVAQVFAAMREGPCDLPVDFVLTLAELGPWRSAGVDLDAASVLDLAIARSLRPGHTDLLRLPDFLPAFARLRARLALPADLDLADLITTAGGCAAHRVELAVERLGRRGHPDALPILQTILHRPDPRLLPGTATVPLRRRAAEAILAITTTGTAASQARAFLDGVAAPPPAPAPVPARAAARAAELIAELALPGRRDAARQCLQALQQAAVPSLTHALAGCRDGEHLAALLAVLREIGPRAADATPALLDLLLRAPVADAPAILRTLAVTAPWCRDVTPIIDTLVGAERITVLGRHLGAPRTPADIEAILAAAAECNAALQVDPRCTLAELERLLADDDPLVRRRALVVIGERGPAAAALLPELADTLAFAADPDPAHGTHDDDLREATARAILRIAAPDHPLAERAQRALAALAVTGN